MVGSDRYHNADDDRNADVLALAEPDDSSHACTVSGYAYRMGVKLQSHAARTLPAVRGAHTLYVYVHRYNAGPLTGYAPSTHRVLLGETRGGADIGTGAVAAC